MKYTDDVYNAEDSDVPSCSYKKTDENTYGQRFEEVEDSNYGRRNELLEDIHVNGIARDMSYSDSVESSLSSIGYRRFNEFSEDTSSEQCEDTVSTKCEDLPENTLSKLSMLPEDSIDKGKFGERSNDAISELSVDTEEIDVPVIFKALKIPAVTKLLDDSLTHVCDATAMPRSFGLTCLWLYRFDKSRLLEDFFAHEDPSFFFSDVGIVNPFEHTTFDQRPIYRSLADLPIADQLKIESVECSICYRDVHWKMMAGVGCSHTFCECCWIAYAEDKIYLLTDFISCPVLDCTIVAPFSFIYKRVSRSLQKIYKKIFIDSFVRFNPLLQWCLSRKCQTIIHASTIPKDGTVCVCSCGEQFCFGCRLFPHDPVPCSMVRGWSVTCEFWHNKRMVLDAKACPNCRCFMEKDGVCTDMICFRCKYHFCWKCGQPWHLNECILSPSGENFVFFERAKQYGRLYDIQRDFLMKEYIHDSESFRVKYNAVAHMNNNDPEDHGLMEEVIAAAIEHSRHLSTSYIFASYTENSEHRTQFISLKNDFASALRTLKSLFKAILEDKNPITRKQKMISLSEVRYACRDNQELMLNHIRDGYTNNWWIYNSCYVWANPQNVGINIMGLTGLFMPVRPR